MMCEVCEARAKLPAAQLVLRMPSNDSTGACVLGWGLLAVLAVKIPATWGAQLWHLAATTHSTECMRISKGLAGVK